MIKQAISTYKETMTYRIADSENLENKFSFTFALLNQIIQYYTENQSNDFILVKELSKNSNYDSEEREIHFDINNKIITYRISHTNKTMDKGIASQGEFKFNNEEWCKLMQYAAIADFAQDDLNEMNMLMFSNNKPKIKISNNQTK